MSQFNLSLSDHSSKLFYLTAVLQIALAAIQVSMADYLMAVVMAVSAVFFALGGYYEPEEKDKEE